jgi:hypothetical protein
MNNRRRRFRSCGLPERFQEFTDPFLVGFGMAPRQWRWSRCHFSGRIAGPFGRFSGGSGQQLEQKRKANEEKENEIFQMKGEHVRG